MSTDAPAAETGRWEFRSRVAERLLTGVYVAGAAAMLIQAGWRRFQLPQEPVIDPDIHGYLGPALSALAGKGFVHIDGRSFPYPAFVYLILRVFGDFRAIAVTQHLLGIAAGALILLAWNAAGRLTPEGGIPGALFRLLGLAPAWISLDSATAISYEHQVRPEAIYPFLVILNIWLSFRYLEERFVRKRRGYLWLGSLNVFVTCLIYMVKPSFGFAVVFCTLPVWLSLVLPGTGSKERAWLATGAILPALLLLILPEHLLKAGDGTATLFLPETLFTVHAGLIEHQMDEDLSGIAPLPYPRDMVTAARDMLAAELAKAAHVTTKTYPSLGYNPDYLMYEDSFCANFPKEMHFTTKAMADFCMTWYRRTATHQPWGMAAKVRRELAIFYARRNPAYWEGKGIKVSEQGYSRVESIMPARTQMAQENPSVARYVAECRRLAGAGIVIPQTRRFVKYLRDLAWGYLPALWIGGLSPVLLVFPRLRAHFLWLIAAVWLAYSYNFGNSLTVAVIHSLDVNRYVRIQLIYTVFAQCLAYALVLELAAFAARAGLARMGGRKGGTA